MGEYFIECLKMYLIGCLLTMGIGFVVGVVIVIIGWVISRMSGD